jgi:tetratricopeptide (TPR) repeat protein
MLPVLLLLSLDGCLPSSQSQMEEEKEPHFLAGKSCINNMDFKGAIEEFEKALEANPHSASAHFQLGWLYEEREPDPAAAIYHYERFLKLHPNSDNAEVIKQHITNCKQDLAKTILPLPMTPGLQHEFEQLAEENKRLRDETEKWRVYAGRLQASTNPPPIQSSSARGTPASAIPQLGQTNAAQASAAEARSPAGSGTARTYIVKAGDSPYSIARKNGVKVDALMAANPGLDARRLRPGQTLNLPSP